MNSLDAIYFGNAFTTRVAQGVIQKEEREGEIGKEREWK